MVCSCGAVLPLQRIGFFVGSTILVLGAGGCSQNGGSGNGAVCVAQERTIAPIDPNAGSGIILRGGYVYVQQRDAGPNYTRSFTRVPVSGGPTETLADSKAGDFAANDANTVVWEDLAATPPVLEWRGPQQESRTLALPDGVQSIADLALDRAGNVFVLAIDPKGGNTVWRYSAEHQTFDLLHHNIAGLTGFFEDATGIAWLGPATGGTALYHEDVTGGAPQVSANLSKQNLGPYNGVGSVVGLDATALYVANGNHVMAIDRTTGTSTTALDLTPEQGTASGMGPIQPDYTSVRMDDASFYWVERDRDQGTASIRRTDKSGKGSVSTLTTITDVQSLAVGGCSLAYVGAQDSSSWGIVARPK